MKRSHWIRTFLPIAFVALGAGAARAQFVPLGGAVYDGAGGPLLSGTVYHAVNHLTVPDGTTLTVEAGAILKFGSAFSMTVNGTLGVAGTAVSPVVFSSIKDDLAGGDTNGDGGLTSPVPGDWDTLVFGPNSDASSLDHLDLAYAGIGFYGNAGITLSSADVEMRDCVVRGCGFAALNLTSSSFPDVRSSTFHDNGGRAIEGASLRAVPGFVDNAAYGNAGGNSMRVVDGNVGSDLELFAGNCLEGALVIANNVTVADGAALTLDSGVVFKFEGPLIMNVNGTLATGGTIPFPVVFTSLADDSVGGDTNNNGPSSGAPGEWIGLSLGPNSDASFLYGLEVRHAGHWFYSLAGITLSSSDARLESCTVSDCAFAGLDLTNSSLPSVTSCSFQDNGGGAVRNAPIEAVPGFTQNSSAGNAGGDCIDVPSDAIVAWDLAISSANLPGGALVVGNHFGVVPGATWTLGEGVVIKVRGTLKAEIEGTLAVGGSAANPVVITSIGDDSVAGDTGKDGPTSGAPGEWIGMYFRDGSDASDASYLEVRHAGWPVYAAAGITLDRSDARLMDCTIRDCAYAGLDLASYGGGAGSLPTVAGCAFQGNGGVAVTNARIDAVPGFTGSTVAGNGGDYMQINDPSPASDVAIGPANCPGGALVFVTSATVPAGVTLTLEPGVVIKSSNTNLISVYGSLDLLGTPGSPVVFTAFADDDFGGDSNGDGSATMPAKGTWTGIAYLSASEASTANEVLIRYAGAHYAYAGFNALSPLLAARAVRVEHCANDGFEVWAHSGDPQSWIAHDCDLFGIDLWGGSFTLRHATVHACGAGGIRDANWSFAGGVVDSIAWGNLGPNFSGLANGDVRYSNGDRMLAGTSGNLDVDPLFVDAAAGDLHLAQASPCIDAGDPLSMLDPDGTRTDMGAYAFDQCAPFTYCMPKPNAQNCAMTIGFSGTASTIGGPFLITVGEAVNNKSGLFFYGKSGPAALPYQGGFFCAKGPFKRTPLQSSGGNPPPEDCSGSFALDFNAWIQAGKDPLLVPGVTVNAQFWCRDDAGTGSVGLSDGVQFRICQ